MKKRTLRLGCLLLSALLLALLCGGCGEGSADETSDAGRPLTEWDQRLVDRLDLDQEAADRLLPDLQEANAQAAKDGVMFQLGQVLQTEGKVYAALDITFPADFPFPESYLESVETSNAALAIYTIVLLPENRTVESLSELAELEAQYPMGYSVQLCSADQEANRHSYLLDLTPQDLDGTETGYTLALGHLEWRGETLFEGPVSLGWDVN